MIKYDQTRLGCTRISSLNDNRNSHISITQDTDLGNNNPVFSIRVTLWLMVMHYPTTFGYKRFGGPEITVQTNN